MCKKLTIISIIAFLCALSTRAQVDNFALKLADNSSVSFGNISEMNGLSSYTIQFWICPSAWNKGAVVYQEENSFGARLGDDTELVFFAGKESFSVKSPGLGVNKWAHITLVNDKGELTVLINNQVAKTLSLAFKIPATNAIFELGGSFSGRLDEFRIWGTVLSSDYEYMWRNTLNKFHPQWKDLIVYYKFDQDLCPNVVDYTFRHHGAFAGQSGREIVTDNPDFTYSVVAAYTDFGRFTDRAIDKDKYLLANTLIILGINSYSDGTVNVGYPDNQGTVTNGTYMTDYKGRKGILALNGNGAQMEVGTKALRSASTYCFHTWIYLEEWTEGAFIFKKEASDTKGFSIRLGAEDSKQIIVRLNGKEYIRDKKMEVGKWVHLGISTNKEKGKGELYLFTFDGVASFPSRGNFPNEEISYVLPDLSDVPAVVGLNLHAKLDETVVWAGGKSQAQLESIMNNGVIMPGFDIQLDASLLWPTDSYWAYDKPDNPGYDSYSFKHYINIMRSAYDGHRGFKIKMSVSGHSGWETTFSDAGLRKKLGENIAKLINETDLDGVDLDFEWTYSDAGWKNYALVVEQIHKNLKPGKLLTVTPHNVSYRFPVEYMKYVDYFLFQVYGPNDKNIFTRNGYKAAYDKFLSWGYPKEKIVLSYATTTSAGMDENGTVIKNGNATAYPPVGIRNLFDEYYSPEIDRIYQKSPGCYRLFCGYDQTLWRNQFVRDNQLRGIMYWDMGNDVKTSHPYSLVKGAGFILNSNVDTLVTKVSTDPVGNIPIVCSGNSGKLEVYPTWAHETVSFVLAEGEVPESVKIFDVAGSCVVCKKTGETSLYVGNLSEGNYFVRLVTASGKALTGRFIKK